MAAQETTVLHHMPFALTDLVHTASWRVARSHDASHLSTEPQGQRVLFCGPPGSGKKRAVRWLAQQASVEVVRIDVSSCLSTYIGETEKNLRQLLAQAETAHAVLLFDEADALFGKRTSQQPSDGDKYANQEVSYLRQVFAAYPGMLIVSTRAAVQVPALWLRLFDKVVSFKPAA